MLHRIFGEILAGAFLDGLLEALHEFLEVGRGQVGVQLGPLRVLHLIHDLLEGVDIFLRMRLEAEHDIAVHLHETAIAVPGEALIAGLFDQAAQGILIEADIEHGVHHARHAHTRAGTARD